MDYFAVEPQFNTLGLVDLLRARDQFHPHLIHKANVVGTAIGRYLIRTTDPYPQKGEQPSRTEPKGARTLENSEVREYSWPAVLVFVTEWVDEADFGGHGPYHASDLVPKRIYLDDGRSVPVCVVQAPMVAEAPPPLDLADLKFPEMQYSGGYPVLSRVQEAMHIGSLGCLVTDGHAIYVLTSRHVTGPAGTVLMTQSRAATTRIGCSTDRQIARVPFERLYDAWPGKRVYVNMDVGLIEVDDRTVWSPAIYRLGSIGPLADLSVYNLTLNLIGCPVKAYGAASGYLSGRIAALFYRYRSVGGFDYVADFLIGSRGDEPLRTRPGDSGTVWVVESDQVEYDLAPIAVQWGGAVFEGATAPLPFALATNLSNVCRELNVELYRSQDLASFEYWEAVGHYSVGSYACEQIADARLLKLMRANKTRVSFERALITRKLNDVTVPGFVQLANVPDKVWKKPYNKDTARYGRRGRENPNHYADIDFKGPDGKTLDDLTPNVASLTVVRWRAYYDAVGAKDDRERGLLPFRVWQLYKEMVKYVHDGQVDRYVAAAGVLAHYVGDACQPLHGSFLSDGDPFRNPDGSKAAKMLGHGKGYGGGVHGAYEGDMIDAHIKELLDGLEGRLGPSHGMTQVHGGQAAGYATIELMRRTRQRIAPKTLVESYGALVKAGKKSQGPTLLWDKFGAPTIEVIADGCRTLAMLWESAWLEGAGANIPDSALRAQLPSTLKRIYETQKFAPSVPLGPSKDGQIDTYL